MPRSMACPSASFAKAARTMESDSFTGAGVGSTAAPAVAMVSEPSGSVAAMLTRRAGGPCELRVGLAVLTPAAAAAVPSPGLLLLSAPAGSRTALVLLTDALRCCAPAVSWLPAGSAVEAARTLPGGGDPPLLGASRAKVLSSRVCSICWNTCRKRGAMAAAHTSDTTPSLF